jgi:cell division protein FtsZ
MGIGSASGENRSSEAARAAISSPLLEQSVEGATGILLNITGGGDLGLFEVNEAAEIIQSAAASDSNIIFGAVIDDVLDDELRVTVIATGFDKRGAAPIEPPAFDVEPSQRRSATRRTPTMDDRQRNSLEIPDDEIDIPSFLKD